MGVMWLAHAHAPTHAHTCTHTCTLACTDLRIHTCAHTHAHPMHTHMRTHACTHAHTHAHTNAHHTCTHMAFFSTRSTRPRRIAGGRLTRSVTPVVCRRVGACVCVCVRVRVCVCLREACLCTRRFPGRVAAREACPQGSHQNLPRFVCLRVHAPVPRPRRRSRGLPVHATLH